MARLAYFIAAAGLAAVEEGGGEEGEEGGEGEGGQTVIASEDVGEEDMAEVNSEEILEPEDVAALSEINLDVETGMA